MLEHSWSEWRQEGAQHTRTCQTCPASNPATETFPCTGGTATCTERAICETCKQPYGEPNGHDIHLTEWIGMTGRGLAEVRYACNNCTAVDGRVATMDFSKTVTQPATCSTDELSTVIVTPKLLIDGVWYYPESTTYAGVKTGERLGHQPGAEPTCTADQICIREGCGEVLTPRLGHQPGAAATCTTDQVCIRGGCGKDHRPYPCHR